MLFTWFLGEPVIKALKTWNTLGERFLKENRIGILHDCGFDTGRLPMGRIRGNLRIYSSLTSRPWPVVECWIVRWKNWPITSI